MRKISLFAFLFSILMAPKLSIAAAPPALDGVHRIVCLGDSITQFGDGPGGYVWLFRHFLQHLYPSQNIEVINAGISGNKSDQMLARFQHDVLDPQPDMITISCGVNDVWHGFYDNHPNGDGPRGIKLPEYTANIEKMIDMALAKHVKVVLLSTTVIYENYDSPENIKLKSYNAALKQLAHKYKLLFIDFQPVYWKILNAYHSTGASINLLTVDGVHMNPAGNQLMAHVILDGLGIPIADQRSVEKSVDQDKSTP